MRQRVNLKINRVFMTVASLVFFLLFQIGSVVKIPVEAMDIDGDENSGYEAWYEDGELKYPMTMDDAEWKALSFTEKYEVCQIPDDVLCDLSTEELLYMVEMYPNFTVTYRYDTPEEAFQNLLENFNGIEELLSRDDCLDVVLSEYQNYNISTETHFDYEENINGATEAADMNEIMEDEDLMKLVRQDAQEKYTVNILEMILASLPVQSMMEESDYEELTEAMNEKAVMKLNSDCFEHEATNCYSGVVTSAYAQPRTTTIHTRSGNDVSYYTVSNPTVITQAESMTWISSYDGCSIVETGTTAYNCFAYAWLSLDSWNKPYRKSVFVRSQTPFTADNKYKKTLTAQYRGQVVSWGGHAGVVERVSYSYLTSNGNYVTEPLIISKWTTGPLVQHPISQGDWGNTYEFYK